MNYDYQICYIRFLGTHAEYEQIDAERVCGSMRIRPIKTESDYRMALAEIERLMSASQKTVTGDRLEVLVTLVERYESERDPIEPPDPIEALIHHMESRGLTRRDLEAYLGSRARVAEVLNRKRPLSLEMIRKLHKGLGIPAEVLIQPYVVKRPAA
jgi:HTH-type transcriptional regulator / antitoxin HigA